MATAVTLNGTNYSIPSTGDSSWGDAVSSYLIALATGVLSKSGGSFALTSDANFGATFGLISKYFTSVSTNPASTGAVRLANGDSISFRNVGNTADIALKPNADGILQYNSVDLVNLSATQTLTNKTISGASNTLSNIGYSALTLTGSIVNADISGTAAIAYSKLALTGSIVNADISGTAAIAYSKLSLASSILSTDLANSAVTNAKMANMANNTVKGNVSGISAAPSDLTLASAATGSSVMYRDSNANTSANNFNKGYATTATSAGVTTLTAASAYQQFFTGTTTQTVKLPDCTTLATGWQFLVVNNSSGNVTVQNSAGTSQQVMGANTQAWFTCTSTGSAAGSWQTQYISQVSGTVTSVALSMPAEFSVTGSPVTSTGTLSVSKASQSANTFFAAPDGSAGTPSFRALATGDFVAPTVQKFTSGSGTYTLPTSPRSPKYIRVRMVGGGGGGGGSGDSVATTGGTGGNSTFGTTLLVANGAVAAAGGTASLGTGPIGLSTTGGSGTGTTAYASSIGHATGSPGAASPFGGAGGGGGATAAGSAGVANTGSGGGGGGANSSGGNGVGGAGGGAGGFVDAVITSPSASYSYSVGAGGSAGTAGTNGVAGGAGGSGIIVVEEFYQ